MYICNGHSQTDARGCSGVTAMQLPWLLAKANGFILVSVSECLPGFIAVLLI